MLTYLKSTVRAILNTLEFSREYLGNGYRSQQSETNFIDCHYCLLDEKMGKLWFTNKRGMCADVDLP